MDHGKIISRAWDIGWENKWMFGLGAIAALTSGVQVGGNQNAFDFSTLPSDGGLPPFMENSPIVQELMRLESGADPFTVFSALIPLLSVIGIVIAVAIILSIIFWFIGLGGRAGLILAVHRAEQNVQSTFQQNLKDGFGYTIPLFLMKLALYGSLFLMFFLIIGISVGVSVVAGSSEAIGGMVALLSCLMVCMIVPIMFAINYIDAYAFRGIVLSDKGTLASLSHGWSLFSKNLGDSFLLGLIYWVVGLVISLIIGFIITPLSLLFANPILEYLLGGTISSGTTASAAIGGIVLTIVMALLMGVLVTWQSAGFTLAYREFMGMQPFIAPVAKEKQPSFDNFDDRGDFI
ncbi:MAG: DUF7544 domain-containing protein [Candidatus Promineifilaceae bacterium]